MTEIQTGAEFKSPPARPTGDLKNPPNLLLRDDDLQNIYAALTKGEGALARRRDLGEMHKRLVAMITTLNQGLGDAQTAKAAADREIIDQRLDQMERAVNSMDGALRIELEPMLRTIVSQAVDANSVRGLGRPVRLSLIAFFFCVGLALGSIYNAQIGQFSENIKSMFFQNTKGLIVESSPIGGSAKVANLLK